MMAVLHIACTMQYALASMAACSLHLVVGSYMNLLTMPPQWGCEVAGGAAGTSLPPPGPGPWLSCRQREWHASHRHATRCMMLRLAGVALLLHVHASHVMSALAMAHHSATASARAEQILSQVAAAMLVLYVADGWLWLAASVYAKMPKTHLAATPCTHAHACAQLK